MQDAIAVQDLKQDIALLKQNIWPPTELAVVQGLPIYYAHPAAADAYFQQWLPLIERAQDLYQPFMQEECIDQVHLPSHLNLPIFFFNVDRIRINRTFAKESKSFRSVASAVERCGQFEAAEIQAMQHWLQQDEQAVLVAHREFIDLRTYVFQHGQSEYTRTRFYLNGIVLSIAADFAIIDARDKPRKRRSDCYQDALADNQTWKIFGKIR
ncbi:hypothetical protein [Acinetobacter larvae]|uniref:Uncharacterized protein n=1 Tax=Acinetobacter larvae TaxID=1789224 RepID=A0A1B2M189_9GAMM|nr:hypothetical protein [Acinetobacter larvae]AOA58948.1 hypothetical protein BFG52_11710 [Acinetobacter larvae]